MGLRTCLSVCLSVCLSFYHSSTYICSYASTYVQEFRMVLFLQMYIYICSLDRAHAYTSRCVRTYVYMNLSLPLLVSTRNRFHYVQYCDGGSVWLVVTQSRMVASFIFLLQSLKSDWLDSSPTAEFLLVKARGSREIAHHLYW